MYQNIFSFYNRKMIRIRKFYTSYIFPNIKKTNSYILASVVIAITTALCYPLSNEDTYHIVSFILLIVVSLEATFFSTGPVLMAASIGALAWNFFFIPPYKTFNIEKTEDLLMFFMFFIIAFLNGILTIRVRKQEKIAIEKEERTSALFQLTKELSKAKGIAEVLEIAEGDIRKHFSLSPLFILQVSDNTFPTFGNVSNRYGISQDDYDIAYKAFKNSQKAGKFVDTPAQTEYTFYPLHGIKLKPGVVFAKLQVPFTKDSGDYWDNFITQISNALEREFLSEIANKARFLDESDRLYKTLFNSISHELRIPVATILGASDALLLSQHSENVRHELCSEIFRASLRLNRLIENLLNMSRLESGRISARLDWCDINDLINKVSGDLAEELKPFSLLVSIPENMPLVRIDFGLMEQVLYNLIFNSCEHAPVASNIRVNVLHQNNEMIIHVLDRGPGFPEEKIINLFSKFYRIDTNKAGGLGLGLSIVKGFTEAHNGTVKVENRKNGGAKFIITIPTGNPEFPDFSLEKQ